MTAAQIACALLGVHPYLCICPPHRTWRIPPVPNSHPPPPSRTPRRRHHHCHCRPRPQKHARSFVPPLITISRSTTFKSELSWGEGGVGEAMAKKVEEYEMAFNKVRCRSWRGRGG